MVTGPGSCVKWSLISVGNLGHGVSSLIIGFGESQQTGRTDHCINLSQLVCVTIQSYAMLSLLNRYVIFHQAKSFMFYNVQIYY